MVKLGKYILLLILVLFSITAGGVKGSLSKPENATYKRTYPKY